MKDDAYRKITDDNGRDYYCPLGAIGSDNRLIDEGADDCVETEVVQRYSGNISVLRT